MSNNEQPNDSFLSSGAIDPRARTYSHRGSNISPRSGVPRTVPDNIFLPSSLPPTSLDSIMHSPSPSQRPNRPPISPPKTRSASADDDAAALVEDWRAYATKMRDQFEGEKAHMVADRAREKEMWVEERQLYEQERKMLLAKIKQYEAAFRSKTGSETFHPSVPSFRQPFVTGQRFSSQNSTAGSVAGSLDSNSRSIPQESGRNADGTPFYAPAPRNPSRTFNSTSETSGLRVDSCSAPRESAIRVTSKELKSADFVQSPPVGHNLETISETPNESIDISHIQPELEGVQIKASAVSPAFAAKIISPCYSPSKLSPNLKPSNQPDLTSSPPSRKSSSPEVKAIEKEKLTLQVAREPENRRLTMHAGHTPSHSITTFEVMGGSRNSVVFVDVDMNKSPTQHFHRPSIAPGMFGEDGTGDPEEDDDGDRPLTGPLGLTNNKPANDLFLGELHSRLEEVSRSSGVSPSSESGRSSTSHTSEVVSQVEKDEGPGLKLKASTNFGRPFGSM
ncbi:hypothetical protein BJ875DRAFT_236718 [Amylocarpus encephaloides]|uniref:Uncharacterized protein n=1 Tax=Amylocarpus encephaloides TaxID=45428 RepID=A0A9P7Y8Q9_9HELO|nr:hypothetical protein BJ875DRAFT_236718 [Amylocarpus encephaloides]